MFFRPFARLVVAVVMAVAGAAGAQGVPLATLAAVFGELRQGGLVIYLRHTATVPPGIGAAAEQLANCETQRQLSAAGLASAVQIGKAVRSLGIPIGTVTASPYCRTRDTARLAFGRFEESCDLGFVIGADARETERMTESLRRMLATPPAPGTNSVLVSHSANLFEAAGIFAKPEGAAYVFRPLAGGRFEAIARILPEDWSAIVKSKSAQLPEPQPVAVR
jgi:phosphohistidine phosphatase SixA